MSTLIKSLNPNNLKYEYNESLGILDFLDAQSRKDNEDWKAEHVQNKRITSCEDRVGRINAKIDTFLNNLNKLPFEYVQKGNIIAVEILLKLGANIDYINFNNQTLLEAAQNNYQMLVFLLNKGANPNLYMSNGLTQLEAAVNNQDYNLCVALLNKGAQIPARPNLQSESILHKAVKLGNTDIVRLLIDNGAKVDELIRPKRSLKEWFLESFIYPIKKCFGYKVPVPKGESCLHIAAKNGSTPEMINLLLEKGVPAYIKDAVGYKYDSYLPLYYLSQQNQSAPPIEQNNIQPSIDLPANYWQNYTNSRNQDSERSTIPNFN